MPAQEDPDLLDQYLEKQTSRLTVTDNYIWTIIAVAWLVVVCLLQCCRLPSKAEHVALQPTLWILLWIYAKGGKTVSQTG
jgi:hypothetical protein